LSNQSVVTYIITGYEYINTCTLHQWLRLAAKQVSNSLINDSCLSLDLRSFSWTSLFRILCTYEFNQGHSSPL